MKHAIIKDGIVTNVVLVDPGNLCLEDDVCLKWHPPAGSTVVPVSDDLKNSGDPKTRPPSPGDIAVKVTGARARTRPFDYEPGPPREAPVRPLTAEERIAALEREIAALKAR